MFKIGLGFDLQLWPYCYKDKSMGIGRTYQNEQHRQTDRVSGREIVQLTNYLVEIGDIDDLPELKRAMGYLEKFYAQNLRGFYRSVSICIWRIMINPSGNLLKH